jgi:SAM-dependent methyltransferase
MKSAFRAMVPGPVWDMRNRVKKLTGADIHAKVSRVDLRHIARYLKAREYVSGRNVVDVACGGGYGSLILSDVASYRGIDLDYRAIQEAHREFPEFTFDCGSIYELPFPNGSVGAVTSFETLEHLDCPQRAMKEIARVLKHRGIVIGSIPINHPDRIFHYKPYSAAEAFDIFISADLSIAALFIQTDLTFIEKCGSDMANITRGTLIAVMSKGMDESQVSESVNGADVRQSSCFTTHYNSGS